MSCGWCILCNGLTDHRHSPSGEWACYFHFFGPDDFLMGATFAKVRLERNLTWHYGPDHAALILSGEDPATEADIASWRRLGS